jgi:hypothetical protein
VAKTFSGVDTKSWKLVKGNETLKDEKGAVHSFKGYKDAAEASRKLGGVPVRA